jgi:YbbR domain-containing protein
MPVGLFTKHILRKAFLEDWAMKVVALLITLGLWLGVTGLGTKKKERFSTVPLTFRVSNDAEITNAPVQEVSLVLSGDSRRLDEVRSSDLSVSVDLTTVTPADLIVNLDPQSVTVSGLPRGVTLEEIQPLRIPVKLEAVEERDVVVRVETEGTLAPGYEVYSTTVSPAHVRVHGPADYVKTLEQLPTERIDITGRKEGFTARQVPILVANAKTTLLATAVDVQFRIGEKRIERTFHLPVAGTAATVTFTASGPRSALQKLKPEAFKVEMTLDSDGQEVPEVTPPTDLANAVEISNVRTGSDRPPAPK